MPAVPAMIGRVRIGGANHQTERNSLGARKPYSRRLGGEMRITMMPTAAESAAPTAMSSADELSPAPVI